MFNCSLTENISFIFFSIYDLNLGNIYSLLRAKCPCLAGCFYSHSISPRVDWIGLTLAFVLWCSAFAIPCGFSLILPKLGNITSITRSNFEFANESIDWIFAWLKATNGWRLKCYLGIRLLRTESFLICSAASIYLGTEEREGSLVEY